MRQMQVVDHQGSPQTNLSSITFQILFSTGGKHLHQKKKKKAFMQQYVSPAACFLCCRII